jgi:hypothetical protein
VELRKQDDVVVAQTSAFQKWKSVGHPGLVDKEEKEEEHALNRPREKKT